MNKLKTFVNEKIYTFEKRTFYDKDKRDIAGGSKGFIRFVRHTFL